MQLQKNKEALEEFEKAYGMRVDEVLRSKPWEVSTLRNIYGFRCAQCGKNITYGNLKFYDYREYAKCYACQQSADREETKE